jgi:hypothetical protein
MDRRIDQRTRPAGTGPAGAPVVALDYDEIEDTTPSTPYPGSRIRALRRWIAWTWTRLCELFQRGAITKRLPSAHIPK